MTVLFTSPIGPAMAILLQALTFAEKLLMIILSFTYLNLTSENVISPFTLSNFFGDSFSVNSSASRSSSILFVAAAAG